MRNRFSYDCDPEIEYAPAGPVGCTEGDSINVALRSRAVGRSAISSWVKLVATCAVATNTSADRPTTCTVSETAAGPISTSSGTTWVGATVTALVWVPKPLSSKVTA